MDIITRQETALTLHDPQRASELVMYLGLQHMVDAPAMEAGESPLEYVWRVLPQLSPKQLSQAAYHGLWQAMQYKDGLEVGIQLVAFRAYRDGWWHLADERDATDQEFRAWLREILTEDGISSGEATQLASTIINLTWLKANNFPGLPEDLEEIFADRSQYSRWRRVASGLRRLIEQAQKQPTDEVMDAIQDLVEKVTDPTVSTDELDQAATRNQRAIPPVVFEIEGRDQVGRHVVRAYLTDPQLAVLQSRARTLAQWKLAGEQYNTKDMVLAEYRCHRGQWSRRTYDNKKGWSAFQPLTGGAPIGIPEGIPLEDPELDLLYMRQWEDEQ